MGKKTIEIDSKLYDSVMEYCKLNEITDSNKLFEDLLKSGFTIEKYGVSPNVKVVKKEEPTSAPKVETPKGDKDMYNE